MKYLYLYRKTFFILLFFLLRTVAVKATPIADFTPSKTQGCSPVQVIFTNNSTGNNPTYYWDFGNGNTSTLVNPAATFIAPGLYNVQLTVTDNSGSSSVSKTIKVFAKPTADFTTASQGACVLDNFCFTDKSVKGSGNIISWAWDFGDGQSSTLQNPCNAYTFSDKFTVSLIVTDVNGCTHNVIKSKYASVTPTFTLDYNQDLFTTCKPPFTVAFRDSISPSGSGYTYAWDFGDGGTSTSAKPSKTYTKRGKFSVSLKVTNTGGCVKSVTKPFNVQVFDPKADFTPSVTSGCAPLVVDLLNKSLASDTSLLKYAWSTSNGLKSTLTNPQFVFDKPGKYTIKLVVSVKTLTGCADSITKTDIITVADKANVKFEIDVNKFCSAPATIHIASQSTNASNLIWDFGDGTTSNDPNPTKTYIKYGDFKVTVVAQNTNGCNDTFFVGWVSIRRPGFIVMADSLSGCKPLPVSITAIDTGFPLTSWKWYIDDVLQPISGLDFKHIFNEVGIYKVKIIATNDYGCTITKIINITVGDKVPQLSVTVSDTLVCFRNAKVSFKINGLPASGNPNWFIDYGDNINGSLLTHTYNGVGIFDVKANVNYNGCITESSNNAKVRVSGPQTKFVAIVDACPGKPVYLNNYSDGTNNKYTWILGNGDTSYATSLIYTYPKSGKYKITLIAENTITHCTDTMSTYVIRNDAPEPGFKITNPIGCTPLQITLEDTSKYGPGSIRKFSWNIGSIFNESGKTATVDILNSGFYFVELMLTDTNNCRYYLRKDSLVHSYSGFANLTLSPTTGCTPLNVLATGSSVTEIPVVKHTFLWGNGDSTITTNTKSNYIYLKPPSYQTDGFSITYIATDTFGCTFKTAKKVYPSWPNPEFDIIDKKLCGKDSVIFSANQSSSNGYAPYLFMWSLENDRKVNAPQAYSIFNQEDTIIPIKLIKRDANGCVDSLTKWFIVKNKKPVANFSATPTHIDCPGPPVYFSDSSIAGTSPIVNWEWQFGDSSKSMLQNPTKTYLLPGKYDLTLKVTDKVNCESVINKPGYIIISGPIADYSFTPLTGCVPLNVNFIVNAQNTKKYEWDLGDGWTDTNGTLNHIYDRPNIRGLSYRPNLTITDSAGCKRGILSPDSIMVYPLPKPNFAVAKKLLCVNGDAIFTNESTHDIPLKVLNWKFGDGDNYTDTFPFNSAFTHAYANEGNYTIALKATDTLQCSDTTSKVNYISVIADTVAPAPPTILYASVLTNTSVQMDFKPNTESDFDFYTIHYDFAGNIPTTFKERTKIDDTLFTQINLNTLHNVYSYSLTATDVCLNESPSSPIHSTIEVTAQGIINAVQLNWNKYAGWDSVASYEIYRLNESGNYDKIDEVKGDLNQYVDTNITCFKPFYYKVKGIEFAGNLQSAWSDTSGAVPLFEPTTPSVCNIRATVLNDSKVLLEWHQRKFKLPYTTHIYKQTDNESSVFYKEITNSDTTLIDEDVAVDEHSYSYTTYLKDNCGGLSPISNVAKTILLKADLKENDIIKYDPQITWSPYTKWFSDVEFYNVYFKNEQTNAYEKIGTVANGKKLEFNHNYMNNQQFQYCYKVVAYQKDTNTIFSESNTACLLTAPRLYAPNVFTINGDNLNEKFVLGGVFIDTYHIDIYNRYGALVFASDDIHNSWDGTFNGKLCASDVYIYLAEATGRLGQRISLKGNVTLLR